MIAIKEICDKSSPDKEMRKMRDYIECLDFVVEANKAHIQKMAEEKLELKKFIADLIESQHQQGEKLLDLEEKLAEDNETIKFLKSQLKLRDEIADEIEIQRYSTNRALDQVEGLSLELATTKLQVRVITDQLTDAKMEINLYKSEKEALQKLFGEEKAEKWQKSKELEQLKQFEVDACVTKQTLRENQLSTVGNFAWIEEAEEQFQSPKAKGSLSVASDSSSGIPPSIPTHDDSGFSFFASVDDDFLELSAPRSCDSSASSPPRTAKSTPVAKQIATSKKSASRPLQENGNSSLIQPIVVGCKKTALKICDGKTDLLFFADVPLVSSSCQKNLNNDKENKLHNIGNSAIQSSKSRAKPTVVAKKKQSFSKLFSLSRL